MADAGDTADSFPGVCPEVAGWWTDWWRQVAYRGEAGRHLLERDRGVFVAYERQGGRERCEYDTSAVVSAVGM